MIARILDNTRTRPDLSHPMAVTRKALIPERMQVSTEVWAQAAHSIIDGFEAADSWSPLKCLCIAIALLIIGPCIDHTSSHL